MYTHIHTYNIYIYPRVVNASGKYGIYGQGQPIRLQLAYPITQTLSVQQSPRAAFSPPLQGQSPHGLGPCAVVEPNCIHRNTSKEHQVSSYTKGNKGDVANYSRSLEISKHIILCLRRFQRYRALIVMPAAQRTYGTPLDLAVSLQFARRKRSENYMKDIVRSVEASAGKSSGICASIPEG